MKPARSDALAARIQLQLEERSAGAAPKPRPAVPDHELLCRIGGGSYGDVWLARAVTGHFYAVKVVWRANFSSDKPYEREFSGIVRFEPLSRSHPGVISVLHVGRDDAAGCFFYIMELADAVLEASEAGSLSSVEQSAQARNEVAVNAARYAPRTLRADLSARGRLPLGDVLALGVRLADALGHLHRYGLVHRDVKPSNVIFVNGQAKLADIGLVTSADEARSFVGTEGFIPPEGPGSVQADVFALGRLLYEAATGKDRCEFPDLPADLDQWPDRAAFLELNEILARACAPKAAGRHPNAAALAGDLNLAVSGRSVRHAYGIERRLKRATLVMAVAALVALLTVGAVWFQRLERQRADLRAAQEQILRQRAERSERTSRERLRESLLQQALALTASSEPDRRARALEALRSAAEVRPGKDLRDAAVSALATPELKVIRRWHADSPEAIGSRPDAALSRYLRCRQDGGLEILRMIDDAQLVSLPPVGQVPHFGYFSSDGHWLAVKYDDASLRLWNLQSRTNLLVTSSVEGASFAFSADSSALVAGQEDGEIHLVGLPDTRVHWQKHLPSGIGWLAFHPTEPIIAAAVADGTSLQFLRAEDGSLVRVLAVTNLGLVGCWSGDGRQLITAQADYSIRLWDWPGLQDSRVVLRLHRSEPISLTSDPSGRWLASAGWDNEVYWVDASDGRVLLAQPGENVFASNNRAAFLWTRNEQWTLAQFDPAFVPETLVLHEQDKGPRLLGFSPDGQWLASAGPDGVRVLNLGTRQTIAGPIRQSAKALCFSPDSRSLRVISQHSFLTWHFHTASGPTLGSSDSEQGARLETVPLPAELELELAEFAADAQGWVGLGHARNSQRLAWHTGLFGAAEVKAYNWTTPEMEFPVLSPDGRWLAWGNWKKQNAFLLDLRSNLPPVYFRSEGSSTVGFSPNGRWFVVSDQQNVRFYRVTDLQLEHTVARMPPGALPATITFSSDSSMCAITVPPSQVQLVDPDSGNQLVTLETPEPHLLTRQAFSPDNRRLAVASLDHCVLLWDLAKLRAKLSELGLDW